MFNWETRKLQTETSWSSLLHLSQLPLFVVVVVVFKEKSIPSLIGNNEYSSPASHPLVPSQGCGSFSYLPLLSFFTLLAYSHQHSQYPTPCNLCPDFSCLLIARCLNIFCTRSFCYLLFQSLPMKFWTCESFGITSINLFWSQFFFMFTQRWHMIQKICLNVSRIISSDKYK